MVQAYKPVILPYGSLGVGKSTMCQSLSGANETLFVSKRQVSGCTQFLQKTECYDFIIADTPGLNDIMMPTADWGTRWSQSNIIDSHINLAMMVFKCKIRPDDSDFNTLAVMKSTLRNLSANNTALVFTFADQDESMDEEYAIRFYNTLIEGAEGMPLLTPDRVFLFKGKPD